MMRSALAYIFTSLTQLQTDFGEATCHSCNHSILYNKISIISINNQNFYVV